MSVGFLRYVATRLLRALLTVLGVISLLFLLVHVTPGDPVSAILGDQASPEDRAALRAALRLSEPLPAQYLAFLGDVADGTLGHSFRERGTTVAELIARVLPFTAALAVSALGVALCIALPLGALAAVRRGTRWDAAASSFALFGLAVPNIWLGPLLVLCFGVWLGVLPMPGDEPSFASSILPSLTVGMALAAMLTRQTRASLAEVLAEPYIRAARARGIGEATLVFRHALRNALLPVLTIAGAQLGALLSGAVVAEKIFERPGLGSLFLEAFLDRDIPVVQGAALVIALFYVLVNLAIDLLYGLFDPRLRRT